MNCSITELRNKEVINAKTGCRLGLISDVEIDTCSGCIVSIIIWGRGKCFGLLPKEDDIKIKRYKVTYETTEKGTISGIKEEQVNHNGNPQNTIVTAQEGYTFKNWTANKDVTLTDGTTIAKGNPITNEQIVKIKQKAMLGTM